MKNINKKNLSLRIVLSGIVYAIPLVLLILIILHISSFCLIEKEHIKEKAVVLFKEAVEEDFQNRSKCLTENVSIITQPPPITPSDSGLFKTETMEIRTPLVKGRTIDEKITDFLHSVLAIENPIDVYRLDTIFQQKLKEKNIHIATAICLTDTINRMNNHCTHFNVASFIPLFAEPYMLSSVGVSLKTYIKIPRITLIKRMPNLYWVALLGWILFTSSVGYAWHHIRKTIPVLIKDSAEKENVLHKELIQKDQQLESFKLLEEQKNNPKVHIFSPDLLFMKDTKTLRYREEVVKLTPQQQQLLAAFCDVPENVCSVEDLKKIVWKSSVVEENTIQQAISRLNTTLKGVGLSIEYEFKDRYRLRFIKM